MRRCGSLDSARKQRELQHSAGVRARARGRMPFSSLDQVRLNLPTATSGAWQRRIGLPEGALFWPRPGKLTTLSDHHLPQTQSVCISFVPGQRARVLADRSHSAPVGETGLIRPVCGHLEDGVPHAEALFPFKSIYAFINTSDRASPGTGASLVVSSALATTSQISPV